MNQMRKLLKICILAVFVLFQACLKQPSGTTEISLCSEPESVSMPATFGEEDSRTVVVTIRSNRSWTAFVNDLDSPVDPTDEASRVAWVTLSASMHQNRSGVLDEVALELTFTDNDAGSPRRGELDIYCGGGIMARIPISQAASVTP